METAIAGGKIKPGEKGLLLFKYQFIFFLVDYCFSDTSETHLLRFRPSWSSRACCHTAGPVTALTNRMKQVILSGSGDGTYLAW